MTRGDQLLGGWLSVGDPLKVDQNQERYRKQPNALQIQLRELYSLGVAPLNTGL